MQNTREAKTFEFETKPHILIIEGRYYNEIADLQLAGAKAVLDRSQVTYDVVSVPGAFEIPPAIAYAVKGLDFDALRRRYDGFLALGCIVKGDTHHDQIIGMETARALQDLSLRYTLAIGNGILTVNSREQAMERADMKKQNRPGEAAEACLRLMQVKAHFHLNSKRRWVAR